MRKKHAEDCGGCEQCNGAERDAERLEHSDVSVDEVVGVEKHVCKCEESDGIEEDEPARKESDREREREKERERERGSENTCKGAAPLVTQVNKHITHATKANAPNPKVLGLVLRVRE